MISDLQLLEEYVRKKSESSFAALVNRYLNLVHSAALRQVRSPQLAEEVSQSAFIDLARQAHALAPDTILGAWLYQVTRRTAMNVIRREARRQLREQIASELTAMNATANDWTQIEAVLDEAMCGLDEPDRTAILLRYFENKSLRKVGKCLGTTENAAQKRVTRAVEQLRAFLGKRRVTLGASGLVLAISTNAVQSAPAELAAVISTAATLAGKTIALSASTTITKAIAMTTLQKTVAAVTVSVIVAAGIHQAHKSSMLANQVQSLELQQAPLNETIQALQREREQAARELGALRADNARLNRDNGELLKLRNQAAAWKRNEAGPKETGDWLSGSGVRGKLFC